MTDPNVRNIPAFCRYLTDHNLIKPEDILCTGDGFFMVIKSIASILSQKEIHTFPDRGGQLLQCMHFFDDWFLYGVPEGNGHVYSLVKMREQEHDLETGLQADGDTPGVTVSFIAFHTGLLKNCLEDPSAKNRQNFGTEINRVVAYRGQKHHPALKAYFVRSQAEAPYLIAETYVNLIATFSHAGTLNVPTAYAEIYQKRAQSVKHARIPEFLQQNNQDADAMVCDHEKIYIQDAAHLTRYEKRAILATHTGNVSDHSFAAEVRFHALFLTPLAKIRLPFAGSPYASALRADMSIGDKEFQGPTPYYNLSGKMVRTQTKHHPCTPMGSDRDV